MARIDDLIAQISDKLLRQKLEAALSDMKRRQRFGLVFEEHIPETTTLLGFPIQVGASVQRRSDAEAEQLYLVNKVDRRGKIEITPEGGGQPDSAAASELMVVKRFGDPIFPALTSLGAIAGGQKTSRTMQSSMARTFTPCSYSSTCMRARSIASISILPTTPARETGNITIDTLIRKMHGGTANGCP